VDRDNRLYTLVSLKILNSLMKSMMLIWILLNTRSRMMLLTGN
jgi:hypothetical protein